MAASLIKISDGYYSNAELEKLLTEERIVPEVSFTRCAQFLARDLLNARRERDAALKSIRDMQDAENLRLRERICNCGTRIASDKVECDSCFEMLEPRS